MNITSANNVSEWEVELKWPSFLNLTATSAGTKSDYFSGHTTIPAATITYGTDEILAAESLLGTDFVTGHAAGLFDATFKVISAPPPGGALSGSLQLAYKNGTQTWWYNYDTQTFSAFDFACDFPISFTWGVHDVTVTNVTSSGKTVVFQGYTMNINVTVANLGDYDETFNVTVYTNTTAIAVQTMISVPRYYNTTMSMAWNASGFAKGIYSLSAVASIAPGEVNVGTNNMTDGWVYVSMVGDLTGATLFVPDGKCDGRDITVVARCFGSKVGDANYNPNCDIFNRGKVDGRDITVVAKNFGKHDP
jgi:hypothetical protein